MPARLVVKSWPCAVLCAQPRQGALVGRLVKLANLEGQDGHQYIANVEFQFVFPGRQVKTATTHKASRLQSARRSALIHNFLCLCIVVRHERLNFLDDCAVLAKLIARSEDGDILLEPSWEGLAWWQ